MDFSSLRDQVSNLTLYDLKAGVRKVQNAVMNYTEMEAKVREATNNEPWGASSTLMQEIANGTHSYQLLNEIMPMIYKRFTDKSAEEWRQIYKALQLLEFLIKNGSERVVDDARSHLSLIRMLRQFHYIDQNGKDQGINVRNRASELVKLLSDVDTIRAERKKARANRNKFRGIEGGMNVSGMSSSGSRYGGFGSDSLGYGGYSGGVFGDGGGFGGAPSDFQDTGRRASRFEEYDEYDEDESSSQSRPPHTSSRARHETKKPEPSKAPEEDLFEFGNEDPVPSASTAKVTQPAAVSGADILESTVADDDEFDDFQSATPSTQTAPSHQFSLESPLSTATTTSKIQLVAPQPVSSAREANAKSLVGMPSITPTSGTGSLTSPISPPVYSQSTIQPQQKRAPPKPTTYQAATPNYFTSVSAAAANPPSNVSASRPGMTNAQSFASTTSTSSVGNKPAATMGSGDAFSSLWSTASTNAGIKQNGSATNKGPNLASMVREKSSAGIWGAPAASGISPASATSVGGRSQTMTQQPQRGKTTGSSSLDDLLG